MPILRVPRPAVRTHTGGESSTHEVVLSGEGSQVVSGSELGVNAMQSSEKPIVRDDDEVARLVEFPFRLRTIPPLNVDGADKSCVTGVCTRGD